jgi:uncharacterized protein DUF4349
MKGDGVRTVALALAWGVHLVLAGCAAEVKEKETRRFEGRAAPGDDVTMLLSQQAEGLPRDPDAPRRAYRAAGEEPAKPPAPAPPAATPAGDAKRLMIYTASYELLVPSVADSVRNFVERIEGLGGYLQKRENERLTCRVPAARFRELIGGMASFGAVIRESLSAADVTRDYMDLEIRIENAEKSRQRLLAILEKATKVEEVLAIETDLRRLTEEIERMKGELRFLGDQIAFSTVSVLFRSSAPEPAPIRTRERSRFEWLNQVGVEHVLSID